MNGPTRRPRRPLVAFASMFLFYLQHALPGAAQQLPQPPFPSRPRVTFVFAGTCNYQITNTQLNLYILDHPFFEQKHGRPVAVHKAYVQFLEQDVTTVPVAASPCSYNADCYSYPLDDLETVTVSVPGQTQFRPDPLFTTYVPLITKIAPSLALRTDIQPTAVFTTGVLWAFPTLNDYSFPGTGFPTQLLQSAVLLTTTLAWPAQDFTISRSDDPEDRVIFRYTSDSDIVIRVMSVAPSDKCARTPSKPMIDLDFALNFDLGDPQSAVPDPAPVPVPGNVVGNVYIPPCKAIEWFPKALEALLSSSNTKKKAARRDFGPMSSSLGSDCIGGRWP